MLSGSSFCNLAVISLDLLSLYSRSVTSSLMPIVSPLYPPPKSFMTVQHLMDGGCGLVAFGSHLRGYVPVLIHLSIVAFLGVDAVCLQDGSVVEHGPMRVDASQELITDEVPEYLSTSLIL